MARPLSEEDMARIVERLFRPVPYERAQRILQEWDRAGYVHYTDLTTRSSHLRKVVGSRTAQP